MAVLAKTAKGNELMETRTHSLPRRTWQVFITIDGKRDLAELEKIFPGETLTAALATLRAEGLVQTVVGTAATRAAAGTVPVAAVDDESLDNARKLMINAALSFAGHIAGPLIEKLRAAATLDDLRGMREEWRKTVALNPMAMTHLRAIDRQLDKLLP